MMRIHSSQALRRLAIWTVGTALTILFFYHMAQVSFPIFHTVAETLSILVSGALFVVAYYTRRFHRDNWIALLGIGALSAAFLDLLHTLTFPGTSTALANANLSVQLWIAARYLQAGTFIVTALCRRRKPKLEFVIGGYTLATLTLIATIERGIFPSCFLQGQGLTPFKIASEYVIMAAFLFSAGYLERHNERWPRDVRRGLQLSLSLLALSEFAFVHYQDIFSLWVWVGHLFKVAAAIALFRSLVVPMLTRPFALVLREVAENRAAFQRLADRSGEGIIVGDAQGLRYINPTAAHMLGIEGLHLDDMYAKLTEASAKRALIAIRRTDGSPGRARVQVQQIRWEGTPTNLFTLGDVTTELQERTARLETEARYQELFQAMAEGMMVAEPVRDNAGRLITARVLMLNPAAESILGIDAATVTGRSLSELEPNAAQALPIVDQVLADGQPRRLDLHLGRLERDLHLTLFRLPGNRFGAVFEDVTEELARIQRLRWLDLAAEASPAGMLLVDMRPRVLYANPAAARILGFERPESILGQTPPLLAQLGWQAESLLEKLKHTRHLRKELTIQAPGGSQRFLRLNAVLVGEAQHEDARALVMLADVTEEERMRQQFLQAQKMETLGQLASGVAHDFNNVLAAITGFSELLRDDIGPNHPWQDTIQQIHLAAQRGRQLSRQLLSFVRREPPAMQQVDLNRLLEGLASMLCRVIGSEIKLDLQLSAEPVWVKGDPHQLEQVVLNLAVNARDAMPQGGVLTLQTGLLDADQDAAKPEQAALERWAQLIVRDTGIGIKPEIIERIFEPLFTTKPRGKGTGLGLATVQTIISQHKGRIEVDSTPGQGTAFYISLPSSASPKETAVPLRRHATQAMPRGHGEYILLVDDEPLVRMGVARILERLGYRVHTVASGAEALAFCQEKIQAIDLVITDVSMPDMGGLELSQALHQRLPGVPVLYMSGSGLPASLREVGDNFLAKPFTRAELATAVRHALAGTHAHDQRHSKSGAIAPT